MRLDALGWRPPSSDRGGGNTGSAAQNFPRFSSTATVVPEDLFEGFPPGPPETFPDFPICLPAFPRDLLGELT